MVLDAFGIPPRRVLADAERQQEGFDELMAGAAAIREILAELGEKYPPDRQALCDQALIGEAFEHFGDCRLGDAEPCGDVDLAGFARIRDQIGDKLDIVLDELQAARLAHLPEAFHLGLGIDERGGFAHRATGLFDHYVLRMGRRCSGSHLRTC